IAMVLVDETVRGHGVGTALLSHALEFCDRHRVLTVRLDATPLGRPLYERLGFVEQFRLARYEGLPYQAGPGAAVETALPSQWEALAALDQAVTGTDRGQFLL